MGQLRLVWSRTLASGRGEATPLIYDGVMYLPNPSDLIQAFDAATGDMKWEHRRTLPKDLRRSNDGNRNIAIYGTNIIDATSDNQIVAIDARTGTLVWETKVLDHTLRATTSAGPIIANGKVIAGRNCQPDAGGSSCIITAHDAVTGKELWRTRTIAMPGEPGGDTWGDVPAELAGARGRVDGAQLRPRDQPDLHGHVGDEPGAEVHARRQRQAVSLPQLHAGPRRRHRQDRVALPAHRRSLGSGPSLRAPAGGDGRAARST